MSESCLRLAFSNDGKVELLQSNGVTRWASDNDPDFIDEFGDDVLQGHERLQEVTIAAVIDYLIDTEQVTQKQAEDMDVSFGPDIEPMEVDELDVSDQDDDDFDPDWDDDDDDEDDDY